MLVEQIRAPESFDGSEGLLAIFISGKYCEPGLTFFTEPVDELQVAYMRHPTGKVIVPHTHLPVTRKVYSTQEVLYVKSGKVQADIYTTDHQLVARRVLEAGDILILVSGGHGFEVIEQCEMIETKQGPYSGCEEDKHRFIRRGNESVCGGG